ncbi:myb-like protein X isoform X2 [Hoplias malabaricus]|uniref:myb-like protein X isoform X2 n=1 Tax=Hoplias malabaricus TaxID=27720 RepID=UPI003462C593
MASNCVSFTLFLVFFGVGPVFGVVYLQTGTDYTFQPKITGIAQNILWKFKDNKMVEYENSKPDWYKDYKSRGKLDIQSGDLTLKNLRKDDTGLYESEIQVDGKLQYSKHDIEVMDPVPKPYVSCTLNDTAVNLLCSVGSSVLAVFEWSGPNEFYHAGSSLTIPREQSPDTLYICTAKNNVSQNTTNYNLKHCFPGGSNHTAIVSIIIAVAVVAVAVAGGVFIYKKKCKETEDNRTEDKVEVSEKSAVHQEEESENQKDKSQNSGSQERAPLIECNIVDETHPSEEQNHVTDFNDNQEHNSETDTVAPNPDSGDGGESGEQSNSKEDKDKECSADERANTNNDELPEEGTVHPEGESENEKDEFQNEDKSHETVPLIKCNIVDETQPSEGQNHVTDFKDNQEHNSESDTVAPSPDSADGGESGEQSDSKEDKDKECSADERANNTACNHDEKCGDAGGTNKESPAVADRSINQEEKEGSDGGVVERAIEKYEGLAWKPKELFTSTR